LTDSKGFPKLYLLGPLTARPIANKFGVCSFYDASYSGED